MTYAHLTQTKGQMLKDTLELLFHAPDQFDQSLLCHPKSLKRLLREVNRFDGDPKHIGSSQANGLFGDVSSNGSADQHRVTTQKQRRTYLNYIQRAFNELAKADELVGLFETGEAISLAESTFANHITPTTGTQLGVVADQSVRSRALATLVRYLIEHYGHLPPTCGHRVPTSCAIEREVEMRQVKGEPVLPGRPPAEMSELNRMAGVLVGAPASGRTAFLYHLAYTWAKAWSYSQPLAVYVSAPDFLIYARNRRSVHEFIVKQALPQAHRERSKSCARNWRRMNKPTACCCRWTILIDYPRPIRAK